MTISPSITEVINSIEQHDDVVSWVNHALDLSDDDDISISSSSAKDLTKIDERITHLLAALDIACEDTASHLEHTIDEVSRSIPRLTYDLHFMKDNAMSLQTSLAMVTRKSKSIVSNTTMDVLDELRYLDLVKGRMESTKEALREAENWSSLELEVTTLLAEHNYAKAAERLSEANRSMVVFFNTPDYESRRTLMINLQNQLEASLSSALVAAINSQDLGACQSYYSIFRLIQRDSEFRNYYYASRRTSIVAFWHDNPLDETTPSKLFAGFLPTFYANFLSLLDSERVSISAIFPDSISTLSAFISSTMSSLQPSFTQRLSDLSAHYNEEALIQLIASLRATEEFASSVEKIIEKMGKTAAPSTSDEDQPETIISHPHVRRRSTRMSISLRPSSKIIPSTLKSFSADDIDWDQELFQPFLDFQVDYGSLEQRFLEHTLRQILSDEPSRQESMNRARLLRGRAVHVIAAAEQSLARCTSFTHGYGSVGLVQALDQLFESFIDSWTVELHLEQRPPSSHVERSSPGDDLSDMDYTARDWSDFQLSLHLLSSARSVYERISTFEIKLRSSLIQAATHFRLAKNDPANFKIAPSRGEIQLLEQSALNSADLHALFASVENDAFARGVLHDTQQLGVAEALLVKARKAVFAFASSCQISLQGTILSPLRKHLSSYASSPLWNTSGDPRAKRTMTNDLQVPSFSLSPTDTIQKVAEGLLNLPRLFEVYADDDALSFSLHTLPHVDHETLRLPEQTLPESPTQPSHIRRSSLSIVKPASIDPDAVSSAWLASLGHTLLENFTTTILPNIPSLTSAGGAQLASDIEYLSNIVHAINVDFPELNQWREYADLDDNEGKERLSETDVVDPVLQNIARLRGWL